MPAVGGNTQGLKSRQLKSLARLYQRHYPRSALYSKEQGRELAKLSNDIGRQIAVLVDRQGKIVLVLVGDSQSIYIPELSKARFGNSRLRGLRFIHTHFDSELLSEEDLMDMVFLRFDCIVALSVSSEGLPLRVQIGHLLPANVQGKSFEVYPSTVWDNADFDVHAQVLALEEEFSRQTKKHTAHTEKERVLLVSVADTSKTVQKSRMEELAALAKTAGLTPVANMMQRVRRMNPKFILGKGKLIELEVLALQTGAEILIFEQNLSPSQIRNITALTERKVLDRTQLILDIFAQHASSSSGRLQVEMAQLKYMLPRLAGAGHAMSRLMGGIGGRGPGETKLEVDRRRARDRIAKLKKELKNLRERRARTRERRAKTGLPIVALVGYTNVGKSTLLNTLTCSSVFAENKLFATLDPSTRRFRFPEDREIVLTDTVGFIRDLPADLQEAFQATLEELHAADVLLVVADASHPEMAEQLEAVEHILNELELTQIPRMLVLNKWDQVEQDSRVAIKSILPHGIPGSALQRKSLVPVVDAMLSLLKRVSSF